MKSIQRVCLVDDKGHVVKTAVGTFHSHTQLAVTDAGFVLVLDAATMRVLLLDPDLGHVRDVVTAEHGRLNKPRHMHWDDVNSRLYVAEAAGRLVVFQLTP